MKFFICCLILLLPVSSLQAAPRQLKIAYIENTALSGISQKILTQAYKEIDIEVVFYAYPGWRALKLANDGEVDGELHRIAGLNAKYRNLIQVPQSIVKASWYAFSKNPELKVTNWQDLSSFNFTALAGVIYTQTQTQGLNVHFVKSENKLFQLLIKDRVDLAVTNLVAGLSFLKLMNIRDIKPLKTPIDEKKLYHYLHQKNADLVPLVNQVLTRMHKAGRIEEIYNEHIAQLEQR